MTKWQAEYNALTGKAVFTIGDKTQEMYFDEFAEFNTVSVMLNWARQAGREEGMKELAWRVKNAMGELA